MTAWPEARGSGSFLAAVATRAERWLLEPAVPGPRAAEPQPDARPVIAVIGLGPRCGTTTVARALAIELARRDRSGTAIVTAEARGPTAALATAAARRLARAQADSAAASGRLCLIDADAPVVRSLASGRPAPIVLDVGHGRPPESPFALADAAVLVAAPAVEPALADVVAASLTRAGNAPRVLLNRAVDTGGWRTRHVLLVGDARLGARLALAGRDPTPGLARPIADLADALVGEEFE